MSPSPDLRGDRKDESGCKGKIAEPCMSPSPDLKGGWKGWVRPKNETWVIYKNKHGCDALTGVVAKHYLAFIV